MSPRQVLTVLSAGRLAIGLLMIGAPRRVGRRWLGAGGTTSEAGALMRVGGIRDAAVGVGGLLTAQGEADPRPWLGAAAAIDLVDAWATLRAREAPLSRRLPSALFALGAGAVSAASALGEESPPATPAPPGNAR